MSEDCTKCAVLFNSKKRILEYISQLAHTKLPDISQHEILDSLMAREKLGSTGIGKGIAIPHGRLKNTQKTVAIFLVSKNPIQYDSIDQKPVDVFFALLVPEEQCKEHLSTLSAVASMLDDKSMVKRLRKADTDQELFEIMTSN